MRAYQTAYFSSRCSQDAPAGQVRDPPPLGPASALTGSGLIQQVVEVNLGAGSDRLGGACDRYHDDELYLSDSYGGFCDGPLKARTGYR